MTKSIQSLNDSILKNYLKERVGVSLCGKPTTDRITNVRRRRISMTMIRPSLDVVYGICRGLPNDLSVCSKIFSITEESLLDPTRIISNKFLFLNRVGYLIDWLIDWLIDYLINWLIVWLDSALRRIGNISAI